MSRRRGQLVLLAAAALAIALVPMALAHLQLGYDEDRPDGTVAESPVTDVERTLDRAVDRATTAIPARFAWSNRSTAVTAVRSDLRPTLQTLNQSRLASGTAIRVTYNDSRARRVTRANCPGGPNRQFGSCRADRGVVVQSRGGQTHVVAVAFDVRVSKPNGERHAHILVGIGETQR